VRKTTKSGCFAGPEEEKVPLVTPIVPLREPQTSGEAQRPLPRRSELGRDLQPAMPLAACLGSGGHPRHGGPLSQNPGTPPKSPARPRALNPGATPKSSWACSCTVSTLGAMPTSAWACGWFAGGSTSSSSALAAASSLRRCNSCVNRSISNCFSRSSSCSRSKIFFMRSAIEGWDCWVAETGVIDGDSCVVLDIGKIFRVRENGIRFAIPFNESANARARVFASPEGATVNSQGRQPLESVLNEMS